MHRMYITAIRYADGTLDTGAVTQCGLAPVSIVPDSARVGVARAVDCRRCNPPDPPFPVISLSRRTSHRDDDALDSGIGDEFLELPLKIR